MPNNISTKSIAIFNGDMTQLTPVRPGKARILLQKKKAKIISTNPIVLRLNYVKKQEIKINE
jgi:hypothetical protein